MTNLGALPGFECLSVAESINNLGQIAVSSVSEVGSYTGVVWENGGTTPLSIPPAGIWESAGPTAINIHGQVSGIGQTTAPVWRAVVWKNGVFETLDDRPGGDVFGRAEDINDLGQIVGTSNSERVFEPYCGITERSSIWATCRADPGTAWRAPATTPGKSSVVPRSTASVMGCF